MEPLLNNLVEMSIKGVGCINIILGLIGFIYFSQARLTTSDPLRCTIWYVAAGVCAVASVYWALRVTDVIITGVWSMILGRVLFMVLLATLTAIAIATQHQRNN